MIRHFALRVTLALTLCAAASVSYATTEWVEWTRVTGTTMDAHGSFADGRTMLATLNISSIRPAGVMYTTNPAIPGRPDGTNASFILAPTGVPGEMIFAGDEIAVFDLTGFPVNLKTVFGLADMVSPASYRIEILDAMNNVLSLTGIEVNNYNIFYPPTSGSFVADLDVMLDPATGLLSVGTVHDANTGSTYIHSGLVTFSNLPTGAELIRVLSGQDQLSEGVQWYFGGSASIPIPPALWLFGSSLVGLAALARPVKAIS